MDNQTQAQSGKSDDYLEAIDSSLAICGVRMFNALRQPNWLFKLSKYHANQMRNNKILAGVVNQIIAQKTAKQSETGEQANDAIRAEHKVDAASATVAADDDGDDDALTKEKHIFIDRVLKLSLEHPSFSLADVLSECNTILLAVRKR